MELIVENNNLTIQKVYQLKKLLDQITPDNLHTAIDTGTPLGEEIW